MRLVAGGRGVDDRAAGGSRGRASRPRGCRSRPGRGGARSSPIRSRRRDRPAGPSAPRYPRCRTRPLVSQPVCRDSATSAKARRVPARRRSAVRSAVLRLGVTAAALGAPTRSTDTTFIGITGSAGKTTTKTLIVAMLGPGTVATPRGLEPPRAGGEARPADAAERRVLRRGGRRVAQGQRRGDRAADSAADRRRDEDRARPPQGVSDARRRRRGEERARRGAPERRRRRPECRRPARDRDGGWIRRPRRLVRRPRRARRFAPRTSGRPGPIRSSSRSHADGRSLPVRTRLHGKHTATSVLAALGAAHAAGIPLEHAVATVAGFEPVPARMSPVVVGGITFIRDDNKAPAWSFDVVLEWLGEARAARKILVVGTISDYPGSSSEVYERVARRAPPSPTRSYSSGRSPAMSGSSSPIPTVRCRPSPPSARRQITSPPTYATATSSSSRARTGPTTATSGPAAAVPGGTMRRCAS